MIARQRRRRLRIRCLRSHLQLPRAFRLPRSTHAFSWRGRCLALLGAVGLLTGCGNAYQHLAIGEWREVGQAEPPMPPGKATLIVTTLVPGDGPPVLAGDLVKARVTVTTIDGVGNTSRNPPPQVVWLWGRGPSGESDPGKEFSTYGMMGDAQYRVTFIGRRLQEICRDARLYRRTAILTQYGKIVSSGDEPVFQNKRRGTLGWSALERNALRPRSPPGWLR